MESILFFYGFKKCKKDNQFNFCKLSSTDYLVLFINSKYNYADLLLKKYREGADPCDSEPYYEETLRSGFIPERDKEIIKEYYEKYQF